MPIMAAIIIIVSTFFTAIISGITGMAGGLVLMAVLAALLPVSTMMVTHGMIQLVSNGWRAFLLRKDIAWRIVGFYTLGGVAAFCALYAVSFSPSKPWVYIFLGVTPMLVWLPKEQMALDASKPFHAIMCGLSVQSLNTLAGVAGPLLDIFFVKTDMGRHQIVATKAITQVLAHFGKIVFWGLPLFFVAAGLFGVKEESVAEGGYLPPLWLIAMAIPASMTGTYIGKKILDGLTDKAFLQWTKYLVTAIGLYFLIRGILALAF